MAEQESEVRRGPRIGPLDTVGGVVSEMGRVYRQARRSELDAKDAGRLVYMLTQIRTAIEDGDYERRIKELEASG